MTQTIVRLGDFEFRDFEVPESINGGGEQMAAVRKLPGGRRVVQAMGRDDDDIEWSGRFRGADALSRARALDAMRIAGKAQALTFSELSYSVLVRRFIWRQLRAFEIEYQITCLVISDNAAPVLAAGRGPTVDTMVAADLAATTELSDKVGDAKLSGLVGTLDTAIAKVESFQKATQTTIASFVRPIAAVRERVGDLIATAEATITSVATLGGILPGSPLSKLSVSLKDQTAAMDAAATLYAIDALVGRMGTNIAAAGQGGALVTMAGGDLFKLAAQAYGDAAGWSTIAAANGLTDPQVEGLKKVLVPPTKIDTGGVLQP